MKVYEAVAKAFREEGTSAVFGMMGAANQHWLNAIAGLGVSLYNVRHEGPGLAMAEAWATVRGEPGVCTATSGPAVTHLATTSVVASRGRTPLVAFCGDSRWGNDLDDHRLDQARFAAAVECAFLRINSAESACEMVRQAFYIARHESRPVILSAPLDVQHLTIEDLDEYVPSTALLAGRPAYPHPASISEAAEIITSSRRPVVLVGRGAMTSSAGAAVRELAERTGALVSTTLMAMNWPPDIGAFHAGVAGLFSTKTAVELFQDADCVIAVGASLNHFTIEHGYLFPEAKFVQFDKADQVVMGDMRSADCYVQCDARLGVEALNEVLAGRSAQQVGYRADGVRDRLRVSLDDPVKYDIEPGTMDPRDAARTIDDALPDDISLVLSGGHALDISIMLCRKPRPHLIVNRQFGSMSKGIAGVIGAAVGTGNKPTAVIEGDAGFMMYLGEFETAVRYDLPVLVVIMNDQALGSELHKAFADESLDPKLAFVPTPDLGAVGLALGGRGRLVRSAAELRKAVSDWVTDPAPTLIDVRIAANVESIQARRLRGQDEV